MQIPKLNFFPLRLLRERGRRTPNLEHLLHDQVRRPQEHIHPGLILWCLTEEPHWPVLLGDVRDDGDDLGEGDVVVNQVREVEECPGLKGGALALTKPVRRVLVDFVDVGDTEVLA